jgi:hypothetical protein
MHRTPHEQKNALPVEPKASATFFRSMSLFDDNSYHESPRLFRTPLYGHRTCAERSHHSGMMIVIWGLSLLWHPIYYLFYVILAMFIYGLKFNCPCMSVYNKYQRCPCIDLAARCVIKNGSAK